jgi:hypothetical protein
MQTTPVLSTSNMSLNRRALSASSSPLTPNSSSSGSSSSGSSGNTGGSAGGNAGGQSFQQVLSGINDQYSRPMQWLHLLGAIGITGLIISGFIAGQIPNDPAKTSKEKLAFRGQLMHLHESVGLLMLILMVPRVGFRLVSKVRRTVFFEVHVMISLLNLC